MGKQKFSIARYMMTATFENHEIPAWAEVCDGMTEEEMLTAGYPDPEKDWMLPADLWFGIDIMANGKGSDDSVVFSTIAYAIETQNLDLPDWAKKCDGMTAKQMWEKYQCITMRRWMVPRR